MLWHTAVQVDTVLYLYVVYGTVQYGYGHYYLFCGRGSVASLTPTVPGMD